MQNALAMASPYPIKPFHSRKASALKHAVAHGYFKETSYLDCTFSVLIRTYTAAKLQIYGAELDGCMILTIDETLDSLEDDIKVNPLMQILQVEMSC